MQDQTIGPSWVMLMSEEHKDVALRKLCNRLRRFSACNLEMMTWKIFKQEIWSAKLTGRSTPGRSSNFQERWVREASIFGQTVSQ